MTVEALAQIFFLAVTTGLVFAKFSIPRARVQFSQHPTIGPYDGVPMLQFRIGNERDSRLLEAVIRVVLLRTEKTAGGRDDLSHARPQARARALAGAVALVDGAAPHRRDAPAAGATPESLERDEAELILTLSAAPTSSRRNGFYAQTRYEAKDIRWGARHADMLSERPDGRLRLDLRAVPRSRADEADRRFSVWYYLAAVSHPVARESLLVVDDDKIILDLLCRTFKPMYEVHSASSGEAALTVLGRAPASIY